jgi:formylglycine-generating enzyme required for sulfatase activity
MSGNLCEWCSDWYDENYYQTNKIMINPQGQETGTMRVIRGGSWGRFEKDSRTTTRLAHESETGNIDIGFRLALDTWE